MSTTDELIAALRGAAEHDYTAIHDLLLTAADRLASLTAPAGEWETTAEERKNLVRQAGYEPQHQVGETSLWLHWREILPRLLRDFDRLYSALAAKDYLLRLCEEQHHRDEASLSAERDQNKRLVEAGRTLTGWREHDYPEHFDRWTAQYLADRYRAALAQPEEQR